MTDKEKRIPAVFYQSDKGNEPVRKWLKKQDEADRKTIGGDLKDVEYGWPVGMPLCRPLGDGLWEVRSSIGDGQIVRVLFCVHEQKMILLHSFVKKTQKTPGRELDLAMTRKKEIER